MHVIYSLLLGAALLVSLPYWIVQAIRSGKYRAGLAERLGRVPRRVQGNSKPTIWVHAVSVGEVLAISRLVKELERQAPEYKLVVSTTTAAGQKLARDRFGAEHVFYFPLDFAFAIRAYIRVLRPELVVLAETEFWPNFLRIARRSGAQVAVVNARISDRSFPRYRRFRSLLQRVLAHVTVFLAQTAEDARRLTVIGAMAERVTVSGNLKFDVTPGKSVSVIDRLRDALKATGTGPVIVAGSTVEGEEPLILDCFSAVLREYPKAVMVLAPRHPERFASVAELVAESGIPHWLRSTWNAEAVSGGIFLLDTIGELAAAYALADLAFVGGSLVPRGGHNILEPAMHGVATFVGPHTENFRDIISLFQREDAVLVANDAESMKRGWLETLNDTAGRTELGRRAASVVRQQSGATERTIDALLRLLARTSTAGAQR